jgi:hypothetical protein
MSPPNQSISSPQNAKAEQFHDEAKRIIASLFTKLDPDGRGIASPTANCHAFAGTDQSFS